MGFTKKDMPLLLQLAAQNGQTMNKIGAQSADQAMKQQGDMALKQQEHALAEQGAKNRLDQASAYAAANPNSGISVTKEGASINPKDNALRDLLLGKKLNTPQLTPAQEAAEKSSGKMLADYDVNGGKAVIDKDLAQVADVQKDLEDGNRDWYDRKVGGALSTSPTLMGLLAPKEKSRRDRARNAGISIGKATDPNPTEKQIAEIYGQIYDPTAPDAQNAERLRIFHSAQKAKAAQLENANKRYKQTGYATLDAQGGPVAGGGGLSPQEAAELEQLRKELGR